MGTVSHGFHTPEGAFARCYAGDVAMKGTTKAVQVPGGYAYIREYSVERMMRNAKIIHLHEGTNEIQRRTMTGCLKEGKLSNYEYQNFSAVCQPVVPLTRDRIQLKNKRILFPLTAGTPCLPSNLS